MAYASVGMVRSTHQRDCEDRTALDKLRFRGFLPLIKINLREAGEADDGLGQTTKGAAELFICIVDRNHCKSSLRERSRLVTHCLVDGLTFFLTSRRELFRPILR